jgi:hypothetical protein
MRAALRAAVVLPATALLIAAPAPARVLPALLKASFKDRDRNGSGKPPAPLACTVQFTELNDRRRAPELAGVINRRPVVPPQDVQAWLQAVLGGLAVRGVPARFGPVAGDPTAPTARLDLKLAWVSELPGTYAGNVSVHLAARAPGGTTIDKDYRGRATRTAGWSGGVDTMQSAIDGAFADALNAIAPDLTKLCKS